ncbi:MAG: hypothetical protein ACPGYX_04045 [Oceanobacter sp.]
MINLCIRAIFKGDEISTQPIKTNILKVMANPGFITQFKATRFKFEKLIRDTEGRLLVALHLFSPQKEVTPQFERSQLALPIGLGGVVAINNYA